jgi:hypothetical protein
LPQGHAIWEISGSEDVRLQAKACGRLPFQRGNLAGFFSPVKNFWPTLLKAVPAQTLDPEIPCYFPVIPCYSLLSQIIPC